MPVTVSIGGQPPQTFETPWAAIMALLKHLPTNQLGGQRWLDVVRDEKKDRTVGLPGRTGGGHGLGAGVGAAAEAERRGGLTI